MIEYKMPHREQHSNKGTFGKVLNFSGSENYIGAAYLSSKSVLKVGAGLIALSTVDSVIDSVSKLLPEAVYLSRQQGFKNVEAYNVCLIGCGLGVSRKSVKLFADVVTKVKCPLVVDADGLNILAKTNIVLPENTIITPHPLEASRLLGVPLEDVLSDIECTAKELSNKFQCISVLKTHQTVICSKNQSFVNKHGNSALAKAGTGDVLAGIIAGLLAQNVEPFEAAKLGVYLHSRSGELASKKLTEYSVLASDVIDFLPQAIFEIL